MIDKSTLKVLKFIAANQPCTFADIERRFGVDFRYSMQIRFIEKNHFYYLVDRLPDGNALLGITPEGQGAIEEYGRLIQAERRANIALVMAFLALLKPASIDLFEFTKRIVLSLLRLVQQ